MDLDFCSFQIKIALILKSQGTERYELFSQGTYDSQNLRYKTLVIAVKIPGIAASNGYKVMDEKRS